MRQVWAVVFCLAVVSLVTVAVAQDKPLAEVTGALLIGAALVFSVPC
jgi:hypothetical protein